MTKVGRRNLDSSATSLIQSRTLVCHEISRKPRLPTVSAIPGARTVGLPKPRAIPVTGFCETVMLGRHTRRLCIASEGATWCQIGRRAKGRGCASRRGSPVRSLSDLLPPRIVARRVQSHAALASNCLMLAVRVAKRAAVIAAGCRLPTDDSAARPSPRVASCTFGCRGAALGIRSQTCMD